MDFLDSIDVEQTHKKSHRVRSWYLYEQFKSLEKNQTDAAQKLKDKSYQDKLLHRELSERRARRSLCAPSEPRSEAAADDRSCLTASDNDFFESFSEVHDQPAHVTSPDDNPAISDCFGCTDNKYAHIHRCSESPSINSVVEKLNSESVSYHASVSGGILADEIKEELEIVKKSIAENIGRQLETVQGNLQCAQEYTRLREDSSKDEQSSRDDRSSKYGDYYDDESTCSTEYVREHDDDYSNVYTMWTKLVSFAHQVVRLNHGNCYYDYSSQFLTAVLACDVLWRGVNKMCKQFKNIIIHKRIYMIYYWFKMQSVLKCLSHLINLPYVSPIKFSTDETPIRSIKKQKQIKRKFPTVKIKQPKKYFGNKKKQANWSHDVKRSNAKSLSATCCGDRKYRNKNWRHLDLNEIGKKHRIASEPWHKLSACLLSEKRSSTIWPDEFNSKCSEHHSMCSRNARVPNPMLKLASYIDSIVTEIGDSTL